MATIKAYTDISQSKTLSKILPLESADMYYTPSLIKGHTGYFPHLKRKLPIDWDIEQAIPCWSLASLLSILPKNLNIGRPSLESNYKGYYWIQYYDEFMKPINYKTECFNNPIDACVAMIEKLNGLKLL